MDDNDDDDSNSSRIACSDGIGKQLKDLLNSNDLSLISILNRYGYTRNDNVVVYTSEDVYNFTEQGDIDGVRAALNFGDNCENWYEGADSKTAIHKAAGSGRLDIVALLIDKGADVNAETWYFHMTPIHFAAYLLLTPKL